MQTTITNLNSTQNSLSSAQNSMSANISTLENRVATNETNITTLQESADAVGEFDERIKNIEFNNDIPYNLCNKQNLVLHMNSDSHFVKSRRFYYCTRDKGYIEQNFELFYESSGQGTITLNFYENEVLEKTYTINLQENPNSYSFQLIYMPTNNYQNFQIEVSSTSKVVYNNLYCYFKGINTHIFNYDHDLKISVSNNIVYVTQYEGTKIKYGMFDKNSFDFNTMVLPWSIDDSVEDVKNIYAEFTTTFTTNTNGFIDSITPYFVIEKSDNVYYFYTVNIETGELTLDKQYNFGTSYKIETRLTEAIATSHFYQKKYPSYITISGSTANCSSLVYPFKKRFYNNTFPMNNIIAINRGAITFSVLSSISLFEDGGQYFFHNKNITTPLFIDYGTDVVCFLKSNDVYIIYVFNGNSAKKYRTTRLGATYQYTIENCDYLYEISDTLIVKHTPNGWVQEIIE